MKHIIKLEKEFVFQTYKRHELYLIKGKDKYVWDYNGKKYLDFFAGISVCNVGHCHPRVVNAIKKQAEKLIHVSNHYYAQPYVELARELAKKTFPGKVFFSNSGAEANECAIKLARKWGNPRGKNEIIVFSGSFHGRTIATLTATGQVKFHKGFEPLVPGFKYAKFNDLSSVRKLINSKTAAILIEPVQGEGGVYPASKEFLKGLKKLCKKHGLMLIFDEIQTGIGRTGELFAYKHYGVVPDVITLAKSLAGGLPIAATVVNKKYESVFSYGDHGSTFGGNLVPCSAALEVLDIITPRLLSNTRNIGKYFIEKLIKLKQKYDFVKEIRGLGLMIGLELAFNGRDIVKSCQDKGLIINCTNDNVLRFLPPLTINKTDVDKAVSILDDIFGKLNV
ncbi:MAG: aspartate aminotransferase family protein [Elusimicrobia bacterium]|nr:aspartate aminotransferase family protein [Candidatus Liberimonas magnetica]